LDNRRIILSKGYNVVLKPEIQIKSLPIFQIGAWWFEGEEDGASNRIDFSITAPNNIFSSQDKQYLNKQVGMEFTIPQGWEISSIGGRGKYNLSIEMWNETHDARIYLYSRAWRKDEPRLTAKQIAINDLRFFQKNTPKFILLDQNTQKYLYNDGYGFLAVMTSFGYSDYYARYVYFPSDKNIYWLIFHTEEKQYMRNHLKFTELLNSLKLSKPEVIK